MANLLTNVAQACADLTNIKNAIQDTGVAIDAGTPSSDYAGLVDEVYEAGKQAEYDKFWDTFQLNGERKYYNYAFYSYTTADMAWTDENFKPKYPIAPLQAISMFQLCAVSGDITKKVDLDFSKCTNVMNLFNYALNITRIGVIDCRAVTAGHLNICPNCNSLETIDEIIMKDDGTQFNANSTTIGFAGCSNLKNVKITGKFPSGANVNCQYSPLTKASFESIINALYEGATGKTATFKKTAKEAAFTDEEWAALIATKPNWTISLV